jgi:hypothetical protein
MLRSKPLTIWFCVIYQSNIRLSLCTIVLNLTLLDYEFLFLFWKDVDGKIMASENCDKIIVHLVEGFRTVIVDENVKVTLIIVTLFFLKNIMVYF